MQISRRALRTSGRLSTAEISVPSTNPPCTAIVSHAVSPGVRWNSATIGALAAVAENHSVMPRSMASESQASCDLGDAIATLTLVQILDEDDFVLLLVVDQLVHFRFHHQDPEAAGSQTFTLPHFHVLDRVVGMADRGVVEAVHRKPWSWICDAVEQHALGAQIGDVHLAFGVEFAAPFDRVHQQLAKRV